MADSLSSKSMGRLLMAFLVDDLAPQHSQPRVSAYDCSRFLAIIELTA